MNGLNKAEYKSNDLSARCGATKRLKLLKKHKCVGFRLGVMRCLCQLVSFNGTGELMRFICVYWIWTSVQFRRPLQLLGPSQELLIVIVIFVIASESPPTPLAVRWNLRVVIVVAV